MKVAIVHDYIKEYGGAERVLETLLEVYPNATVFTTLYAPEFLGPHRARFEKYNIKTTFLNYIPFRHRLISPLRLLSPLAFSSLDLSSYDVVIVSQTGAYFPNLVRKITKNQEPRTKNNAVLICYTHTPPRYLYGYATARDWKKNKIFAVIAGFANHFLRMIDFNSSKNVDFFIANSEEVRARIKKFYRRESIVIYPPVDTAGGRWQVAGGKKSTSHEPRATSYYLTGGRLARAKGIDVIVNSFNENGKALKIFGKGFAGYESELRSLANGKWQMADGNQRDSGQAPTNRDPDNIGARMTDSNIEFLGEVNDEEKLDLMRNAKAFVFASYDEDFGITPVEAMSVGTPVIAYKSGGVKETVIDKKTGIFFDENTPEALISAIKEFERSKIDPKDCIKQAEKFSKERFEKNINEFVNSKIKRKNIIIK